MGNFQNLNMVKINFDPTLTVDCKLGPHLLVPGQEAVLPFTPINFLTGYQYDRGDAHLYTVSTLFVYIYPVVYHLETNKPLIIIIISRPTRL